MILIVLPDITVEDRLLAQARTGDREALMRIYDTYFPPIFNFIRLRVDDTSLAEDLASDVFIKLVETLRGRNAPHHSLRGWLFRVARNRIHDHYRQNRGFTSETLEEWTPSPSDEEPEQQFMRTIQAEQARAALLKLSADQQEVLILRFGQGLGLQETADIMDRQVSAIKSLQFRAVNALRQILGETRQEFGNG
jgi:RNA polymerase sigma-70 factor (ECF subfamily)